MDKSLGTYDNNPYLNSIIYDVEFPYGQVKVYAANIIAENMLTEVDSDGKSTTLMEAIVDHRRDEKRDFNTMTSMSKQTVGGATSGRPQKVASYSSSGRTNLNHGSNWLIRRNHIQLKLLNMQEPEVLIRNLH